MAKNKGSWYEFNDRFVTKINPGDERKIVNNNAYILFYQKRNIDFDAFTNQEDFEFIRNNLVLQKLKYIPDAKELLRPRIPENYQKQFKQIFCTEKVSKRVIKHKRKLLVQIEVKEKIMVRIPKPPTKRKRKKSIGSADGENLALPKKRGRPKGSRNKVSA